MLLVMAGRAPTTMMRVTRRAREDAEALSEATGRPMSAIIEEALAARRKALYWQQFRDAVRQVEADPLAQAEERAELAVYEGTLMDGLEDEGSYPHPGHQRR